MHETRTIGSGLDWVGRSDFAVGAILLGSCTAPRPNGQITLHPGAAWREVVKAGGKPTVKFSYVTAGRKYDLATMENSPNPVAFENSRLFAVLPPAAMAEFDRQIAGHLKTSELPFNKVSVSSTHEVGFRNGKPLWVTYQNAAVRSQAVRYWAAHR